MRTRPGAAREYMRKLIEACDVKAVEAPCHFWPYSRMSAGYAQIGIRENGKVCNYVVSRLICRAVRGPPPSAKHLACHSCDNGHLGCVEPSHIDWGSPSKNQIDRIRACTESLYKPLTRGEFNCNAKLRNREVASLRDEYASRPFNIRKKAKTLGVSHSVLTGALKGSTYAEVGTPPVAIVRTKNISEEMKTKIRKYRKLGFEIGHLANKYGISRATVSRIINN